MEEIEIELLKQLRKGKTIKVFLPDQKDKPQALYITPASAISGETRLGFLISLEGRGSFFYETKSSLTPVQLLKNGFLPTHCAAVARIIQQIFLAPVKEYWKRKPKLLALPGYPHHVKTSRTQKQSCRSSGSKRRSPSKSRRSSPPPENRG